ncbi:MAG: hypothetical protein CMH61_02880 [Nanoarchaeota archaeon]|nr:hypothetical protein [Nanoarchaeota archaeon]|tara:strand:+ start:8024 stop:8707 length:684 start_codon:yes stop_codon:yes gene_type:complete
MNKVRAILADIDGTLTTGGDLTSVNRLLKDKIWIARARGIKFNLASGRRYAEQEAYRDIILSPHSAIEGEGILYEGSCLRMYGSDEVHYLGGLTRDQLDEIDRFVAHFVDGMVPQRDNHLYETVTGYETPSFQESGKTDYGLLERTFKVVKPVVEALYPVDVCMSADAIDIMAKGVTKALPTVRYSEITGIPLSEMAVFCDSGNDMPMAQVVGEAGGLVVYVGNRSD